jgi:TolB protein
MEADGTNWVNLTPDMGLDGGPDFSPDGTKIAFRSFRGGKTDIYLIGVDGTNLVNLTGGEGNNREADWSPDRTKIAFQSNRNGRFQIWVMDVDGSNPVRLTGGQGGANLPHWSPDGTKIVYAEVSFNGTGTSIRTMDADGENKVDIVNRLGLTIDVPLDWSAGLEITTAIESTSWGQIKKDAVLD